MKVLMYETVLYSQQSPFWKAMVQRLDVFELVLNYDTGFDEPDIPIQGASLCGMLIIP